MEKQQILRYDYDTVRADGSDNITRTLLELLNSCPLLGASDIVEFAILDTVKGIAMYPNPSVAVLTEKESITGHVTQICAYSFIIVYRTRTTATNKEKIKELLDNIGRWIEKQEVKGYKLEEYPRLEGNREFTKISRSQQASLYGTTEDKAEDWSISIMAQYTNEFDR